MPLYKCGYNLRAAMSPRFTGLISVCIVLSLSSRIAGFSSQYFKSNNTSKQNNSFKHIAHIEKDIKNLMLRPLNTNKTIGHNKDTKQQWPFKAKEMPIFTFALTNSSYEGIKQQTLYQLKKLQNEYRMPEIANKKVGIANQSQRVNHPNTKQIRNILNQKNDQVINQLRHHFYKMKRPSPLRSKNKNRKPRSFTRIENWQQPTLIMSEDMMPNEEKYQSQHEDYTHAEDKNYQNAIDKKYISSYSTPSINTQVNLIKNRINRRSNTNVNDDNNVQNFPSTVGYIFRAILQNGNEFHNDSSENQTNQVTGSQDLAILQENLKTSVFEHLAKIQTTEEPREDYDILENSAGKFVLNRKTSISPSSSTVLESPLPFSDTSFYIENENILDYSPKDAKTNLKHTNGLDIALKIHMMQNTTTTKMFPALSTDPSIKHVYKFSEVIKDLQKNQTINNVASKRVYNTSNSLLSNPVFYFQNEFKNESSSNEFHNTTVNLTSPVIPDEDPHSRKPKMSISGKPHKTNKAYSKDYFDLDYGDEFKELSIPEFHPGTLIHFSGPFQRRPMYEIDEKLTSSSSSPRSRQNEYTYLAKNRGATTRANVHQSTKEELNAIGSTFYPFRLEDVSMQFADKTTSISRTTFANSINTQTQNTKVRAHDINKVDEEDDDDYRDIRETSLTMETLAYFLIGTCCGLSILCLCIVVAAIKCRRSLVERRVRKQFRSKLFHPHRHAKMSAATWQQQFLDQLVYRRNEKQPNSSCSSKDTCNCKCVTWSLGVRNLDTQPICPAQNSVYLCGRKRLPFGAASTLQYESMLGRRRQISSPHDFPPPPPPPKTESSNENDSLDEDSATEPIENTCPKQCTCIGLPAWRIHDGPSVYGVCPAVRANQTQTRLANTADRRMELRYINRDCPPPVSGLNYLDRAEGVVYWSSNEERLI